jgi:serine/threonine-protein kinase
VLLGQAQAKLQEGRDLEAIGAIVKVLTKHPDRRSDVRVVEGLYRLANSATREASDTAFSLLQGMMATKGADILYQLWLDKAVRDTTRRRAEKWLRGEQFARSAASTTVLAVRLRLAESCERKHDLLPMAAKAGSATVLTYLRELENEQGCGMDGKSDCFACLRKDGQLKDAIAQISARGGQ